MLNKTFVSLAISIFFALLCCFTFSSLTCAGGPQVWEINSRAELLKGEARGVSITDTGALVLAPGFSSVFDTRETYVWSSATDANGNVYLGTGHDGRIFRVPSNGQGSLLYDAPELDVTALVVGRDGAVYAGTSPDGKVYRIAADGRAEVYFDPADKYIWSLAVMPDGALAVGAGDTGKLYLARAAGANPQTSLLFDTDETHVISLAVDARGNLIAGTDPGGLVLRVGVDGKAFALFDAPLREIHALAPAADGSVYALALSDASAAASRQPTASTPTSSSGTTSGTGGTTTSGGVTTDDASGQAGSLAGAQPTPARSRNELAAARTAVFRILPDGATDVLWSSSTVTGFAVAPAPQGGVLVGTNDKGRIYAVTDDGRDTLLVQATEGQVSSFALRGRDVFAATSNEGKLFRLSAEPTGEGVYESPVRDAKFVAAWGRIRWRGSASGVELQTRAGNTERPDRTWSEWSAARIESGNGATAKSAQVSSPRARFIQWRAVLRRAVNGRGGATESVASSAPRVEDVSIAYLPRNVAPEVTSVTTLPAGIALQSIMQMQNDPNILASGLDPALFGGGGTIQTPPRRIFQKGAVSILWQAEDANGDDLEYTVYYRSLNEETFHSLKEGLRDNFYTVDGAALADGRYAFKIIASDRAQNPQSLALTGERTSEFVEIDNTPPVVRNAGEAQRTDNRVRVAITVEDATGTVRGADVSVDGGEWRGVFPEDGIADSGTETYKLDLPLAAGGGEHTVSLRAFDASGNVGSVRIAVRR